MPAPGKRSTVSLGKIGLELELMAPPGRSRRDLAEALVSARGGRLRRFFHPQGEPSKVAKTPYFENLTLGYAIQDTNGANLAQCVDDLTLQDDLDPNEGPQPGWYRIVSDDSRLLQLAMQVSDPEDELEVVLDPLASLFGTTPEKGEGGMIRVADPTGKAVAIGAPLPGERERPCELVSRPITSNHQQETEALLSLARDLDFFIPSEAATHIHFDAAPLCSAATFANLVMFLGIHSDTIRERFSTNPRCRRLGQWPEELFDIVTKPDFVTLDWAQAKERLREIELSKFCDFNLANMVYEPPGKHTFEVRILPMWIESGPIIDAADYFSQILGWARDNGGQLRKVPRDLAGVFA